VVGAVFPEGTGSEHTCSGGVISAGGVSVVLTAAHCLSGSSEGVRFVPGYHDGLAPYGVWNVVAAFADPRWLRDQDPHRDYVFLQVAPVRDDQESGQNVAGKALQDVVAGDRVAVAPEGGTPVQVIGYPTGINDRPVTCTVPTYRAADYPAFDCHGYVGGTSGAPWLALAQDAPGQLVVRGLIGGRSRGGCVESTSYSPPFDADTLALLTRATSGGAGDSLPDPGSGGC
jgi:V8-like Glu-specific endopeptidase